MEREEIQKALSSEIMPELKPTGDTKLAAVLVVICGQEPTIIMTERPKTMQLHGGEISFPGGTWKQNDDDLLATALRETKEELSLDVSREQVIGQLKPVTTLNSGFTITPFIATMSKMPKLVPNHEIEEILSIPMLPLLKTMTHDPDPLHQSIQEMYTFTYQNKLIWGASARILKQITSILIGK